MSEFAPVERTVQLAFKEPDAVPGAKKVNRFGESLSALIALDEGKQLLLGGDETVEGTPSLEQLVRLSPDEYGQHRSRALQNYFALPDETVDEGRVGEVDIEGMDLLDGKVWLTGSHGANRKAPKRDKSEEQNLKRLQTVERGRNRQLIACIPLEQDDGASKLDKHAGARIQLDLAKLLEDDPHFGPFVRTFGGGSILPSKDNGLDVEGLAAAKGDLGTRLFLGLRGPVLRGFACVLELALGFSQNKDAELELLSLDNGKRYKKHFLELQGLGLRDLCFQQDDLLIMAGPTMALDGPVALFRWRAPFVATTSGDTLTHASTPDESSTLTRELLLPHGAGNDHPEGMVLLPNSREILVVYDSPAPGRLAGQTVAADVFQLP